MKNISLTTAGIAAFLVLTGSPVFAQTTAPTSSASGTRGNAAHTAAITNAVNRANQEITRRINALDAMITRINGMKRISSSTAASLATGINSQIGAMNTLKTQVAADAAANATSSLKADIQSITKSYRIFMLIMPQAAIEAAAGRVQDVANALSALAQKLQSRLTSATSTAAGSSATALADMNTQIAAATASAQAAVNEISGLTPDNGNQATMQTNTAALKDARSKVVAAQHDLNTARQDAQTIISALAHHGHASTTSSAAE